MIAYTDYPIIKLGDISGKEAPIREITVLDYDRDKYCNILVDGVYEQIKSGYIYTNPGRIGEVKCVPISSLEKLPEDYDPNRWDNEE